MFDVTRDTGHVSEKGGAGEDNGVVPNESSQHEKEDVQVEEQQSSMIAS